MKPKLLNIWLAMVVCVSALVLFLFSNLLIYPKVCFYENIKPILYFEYLISIFVFAVTIYIFWMIWRKGYSIELKRIEKKRMIDESMRSLSNNEETTEVIQEKIPEEELCKRCKERRKASDDKDFCNNCRMILTDEAIIRKNIIKEELFQDNIFLSIKGLDKAVAYIKDRYKEDENKNKYLHLKAFGKEIYSLKRLNEENR